MKLPNIDSQNKSHSLIKNKYKIVQGKDNDSSDFKIGSFLNKMKEIPEIRIYLKENFAKNEIDNIFMKDIEKEYAEQYLIKMKIFPTKNLMKKILKLCPLKSCDFELQNEYTYVNNTEKFVKVLHIYPIFDKRKNNLKAIQIHNISSIKSRQNTMSNINQISNINQTINSTENNLFFDRLNKNAENKSRNINKTNKKFLSIETSPQIRNFFGTEDNFKFRKGLSHIRRNNFPINTNTGLLYNKDKIEDMLQKDRENIVNLQLFSNKKTMIKINLSPENIKEKYVSTESNWSTQQIENKGKLTRLSKSILTCKNVLNNEKYFYNLTNMDNLTNEIIKEVDEPIKAEFEIILKDINYILDNFPFDEFIQIKNDENFKINMKKDFTNKITINNQKELVSILQIINSNESCRLIGLTLNLIYWIIFGGNAHIQIDYNTKECLYLKIMKEWEEMSNKIENKNIFYKVFIPLFIIICRIEIENLLSRKYIYLFKEEKNKIDILKRVNAIISEIFDKHGFMNSFNLLCGNQTEFNKKFHPNYLPRYKNKLYATSNFVELLFRNDNKTITNDSFENIKEKRSFIMNQKINYFNFYLNKMNNNLKKRNLEPIFKIKKTTNDNNNDKNKVLLNTKEINLSKINKNDENIKITDYMEKTKKEIINSFSKIKKNIIQNNDL